MKQPTLTFKIKEKEYIFPISNIAFNSNGQIHSVAYYQEGEGNYYFIRGSDDIYRNIHGNLMAIVNFN